jgi:hypothetical protein
MHKHILFHSYVIHSLALGSEIELAVRSRGGKHMQRS